MYRYMDSHPQQGSQMPFTQNHCPTCSAAPPQMGYEWRPHYHSCCNHSCFPGYYSFPPYYQMAPPTPFHWQGCRPMYPEPYPTHYAPPLYYNAMEQPRPEYDKNDTVPYHGFSNKGGNNVKIVEHKADDGKKEKESVVPAGLKDCPYPIVWIPPGYMKNGEKAAPLEQDKKGQSEENEHQSSEMEPGVWNVWLPPDSNGIIRSDKKGGEERKGQRKKEDKNGQLPFPIIWMPPFEKPEETEGKEQKQRTSGEEPKLNFKIIPVMPLAADEGGNKSRVAQENSEGKGALNDAEKAADRGYIPGKEREEITEGKREGSVSMHGENGGKKKPTDSAKGQSSKLPPVCLRVDPLPRKKNGSGNGSSRSPSPPGQRGKLQKASNDGTSDSLPAEGLKAQETTTGKSHGPQQKKKERAVIQVVEQKAGENVDKEPPTGSRNPAMTQPPDKSTTDPCTRVSDDQGVEKPSGEQQAKTSATKDAEGKIPEGGNEDQRGINKSQPDDCEQEEKKLDNAPKAEKINLSDSEAAMIIQSAYRGFEARKWEPLKKLKQLAEVREEVDEVKNRIEALESLSDIQIASRERVMIGETIMRLLLKLDAIQGLNPDFRDIRKLLARELVSLQEKLDSILNQEPEVSDVAEPVKNSTNIEQICEEKDRGAAVEESSTEGLQDSSSAGNYPDGTCDQNLGHSQIPRKEAASVESEGENIPDSEPKSVEEKVQVKSENDIMGAEVDDNVEQHAADMGSVLEPKGEQHDGNLDSDRVVPSEPNSDAELALVGEKCNSEVGSAECPQGDTIHDSNAAADKIEVGEKVVLTAPPISEGHLDMNELPQGTIEENTAMTCHPELKKDDKIEAGGEWGKDGKIEAEENAAQEEEEANMPAIAESTEAGEAKFSESNYQAENDKTTDMNQLQDHSVEAVTEDSEEPQPVVSFVTEEEEEEAEAALDMDQRVQEEHLVEEEKQAAKEEAVAEEVQLAENIGKEEQEKGSHPGVTESDAEGRGSNQEEIENEKLMEENRELREMMEQLINAGKEQLTVISNLTGRVKDLERKLTSRKRKLKTRRQRAPTPHSNRENFPIKCVM